MPSLPIPLFAALVLLFLFARLWVVERRLGALALLLFVCAVQALIIALAQHYLIPYTRLLQPITATFIPPVAWLAYQASAVRPLGRGDLLHSLAPVTALAALLTAPAFLDVFIPGCFVAYGGAILLHALKGPDVHPRAPLESGGLPAMIWLVIGAGLIASAFSDVLIFAAQLAGAEHLRSWIISLYSVGNLLLIGGLSLSGHLQVSPEEEVQSPAVQPDLDEDLWSRIDGYMTQRKPYLDPDLTLSRMSRQLGVPAKTLSITINRATGENVSRYVNNARIAAVQSALMAGEPVTSAMLNSGFNTKSNFNREFLRVTQTSPSKWLASQRP